MDVAVKPSRDAKASIKKGDGDPVVIKSVGIIGAGQMGTGIAHVVALAGYKVALNDLKREAFDTSFAATERNMARQVNKGLLRDADAKAALKRITFAANFDAMSHCDLVIEAATEEEAIKRGIFKELCPRLKPDAMLASNTSSISITRLASTTDRPERFIGMHFMNPVPVMQLVEIIRGIATEDETFQASRTFVESLNAEGFIARSIARHQVKGLSPVKM